MNNSETRSAETSAQNLLQRLLHPERRWLGMNDVCEAFRLSGYGEVMAELCGVRAQEMGLSEVHEWTKQERRAVFGAVFDELGVPPAIAIIPRARLLFRDPALLRKMDVLKDKRKLGQINEVRVRRRARQHKAQIGSFSRTEIILRDKSTCYLCSKVCEPGDIHLDHVIPLSKGGAHSAENLRVACASCNVRKGASIPSAVPC